MKLCLKQEKVITSAISKLVSNADDGKLNLVPSVKTNLIFLEFFNTIAIVSAKYKQRAAALLQRLFSEFINVTCFFYLLSSIFI